MVEKNDLIKISKLKLNNKLFEEEIYRYNTYAKKYGILKSLSNVGGDQVTVYDTSDWPQFSLFNKNVTSYCIKNITKAQGYYYWYNINYGNSYNALHTHGRSIHNMIRCLIYYIKVPENSGDLIFLIDGKEISHAPKEGDLIDFDKNLLHGVEPNFSNENRISIAVNIYNSFKTSGDGKWKRIENQLPKN